MIVLVSVFLALVYRAYPELSPVSGKMTRNDMWPSMGNGNPSSAGPSPQPPGTSTGGVPGGSSFAPLPGPGSWAGSGSWHGSGSGVESADSCFRNGEESLRRGDFERAIAEFTRTVLLQPDRLEAYSRRAEAWRSIGRYDAAAADLSVVLQTQPTDERTLFTRGQLLTFMGRYREAVEDYTAAINQNPSNPSYHLARGQANGRLEDWLTSVTDYSRAIDLGPGNVVAYLERGTAILNAGGDLAQAVSDLSRAVQLNPFLGISFARRSEVYQKLGQNDLAVADLSEAVRLDPTNAAWLAARAEALVRAGSAAAAEADYTTALRLEPTNPRHWAGLGKLQQSGGRLEDAESSFSEAVRLESSRADWLVLRGEARLQLNRLDAALSDFTEAVLRDPAHSTAILGQARVYLARKDFEQALPYLEKAIEANPRLADAYYHRARCHDAANRTEPAIQDCTQALDINPDASEPRLLRAELHYRVGNTDAAYDDMARLVLQRPNDAAVYFTRGRLEARRGRHQLAIKDFTVAIRLDKKNADILAARAFAFRAVRKNWDALFDLAQAVQFDGRYATEYMVQWGIVHGAQRQYNRALADFAVALHIDPSNKSATRGLEMVSKLRETAQAGAGEDQFQAPTSMATIEKGLLGGLELGLIGKAVLRPKKRVKKTGGPRLVAPKRPSPSLPPMPTGQSIDSQIGDQLLEDSPPMELGDEPGPDASVSLPKPRVNTPKDDEVAIGMAPSPPPPPKVVGPLGARATVVPRPTTGTGTQPKLPPLTGTHPKLPALPAGQKATVIPTKKNPSGETKKGFFAGLFGGGAKANSSPVAVVTKAPGRKLSEEELKEERKAKRAKLMGYGKIALIPIGLLLPIMMLWSEIAGPDVAGAIARAKAAGLPISESMSASALFETFEKDSAGSQRKYEDKYVEVMGKVKKVTNSKTAATVLLASTNSKFGVECHLMDREELASVKDGDDVVIQGQSPGRTGNEGHVRLGQCRVKPR